MDNVRLVLPTGNAEADTAAIQQALRELSYDPLYPVVGQLRLSGDYTIVDALTSGSESTKVVSIVGIGSARIHYRGPKTEQPVLTFAGPTRHRVAVCSNLRIDCQLNARGVSFRGLGYQTLAENVYVYNSRQIGIYSENCDGSSLSNCMVEAFTGCGLVVPRWNAASLSSLRFGTQWGCWYAGDAPTSQRSQSVRSYEMLYGKAAAEEHYGESYASDWPQEVGDERCTAFVRGNVQRIDGLIFERCYPCDYPLIQWRASAAAITGCYLESNLTRQSPIVIGGQPGGMGFGTSCVSVREARLGYMSPNEPERPAFIELRGTTDYVSVRDCAIAKCSCVVDASNGRHFRTSVERIAAIQPTLQQSQWIRT